MTLSRTTKAIIVGFYLAASTIFVLALAEAFSK